ncbi:DUF349 domain-containing protein [Flexivirga sp. ID2601S]|uniref:DUF349 domain-containing protein n=2 Tax=Flexivirga aerilata TaxID=1656889 RepID=A0A849AVX7_9MICO|nr:DUF349 domain-containing protein [Flexivirga aerilata]
MSPENSTPENSTEPTPDAPEQAIPAPEQPEQPAAEPEVTPAAASEPATPATDQPAAPAAPRPAPPSPASIKPHPPAAPAVPAAPAAPTAATNSASFGRVAEDGTVFVRTPDGEREVGSYPDATHEEALAYFARKYDELAASANLLLQRVVQTDLSVHDGHEGLRALREQIGSAHVVGDLAQLDATVEQIATALKAKAQVEGEARATARAAAAEQREAVVAEAEQIAAQPVEKVQWKQSTARMRALLDEWKNLQRSGAKLDKPTENALWQRFSAARNGFDKTRRSHFARLDEEHAAVKQRKERLIAEAERLSTSKEWGSTASAFKRLMGEWKQAGRASRADDDKLWARFKAAQDAFFNAKDEVAAVENKEFEANLAVKEELLKEAQALLPVKNVGATKAALHKIQDKWDAAGKVPRKDMDRIEKAMRRVETAVREADDSKWKKTDPELAARAQSMVDQLEKAVADLETELAQAREKGNDKAVKELQESLKARQAWLEQARGGLQDSGR